ncbi:leucyl/phenylalanyl-tRNA--protein transferase [Amaricoccus macauensis]|uniref:leucyl/phenylalanyl-tRNA--protein transferase n=1 Tax=Amaricoccus macauensis TaxID=57001 RepID=UPI003C7C4EBF
MGGPDRQEITPDLLVRAYASGVFPMAEDREARNLFWVDPERRGILPLDGLRVSHRLARTFRTRDFEIRIDTAFAEVIDACAERPETWISERIKDLYRALFERGNAHSVEIWQEGALAGGLYGVSLGGAFFGESMFSRQRDASKLALIALVARLRAGRFLLLDTQFVTDHLMRLGACEISRADYRKRLRDALGVRADFHALDPAASRQELLQLSTQTS